MSKKIYKLLIVFDGEDDVCEALSETVDVVTDDDELLTIEDYENKDIRDVLIKSQIMGDA